MPGPRIEPALDLLQLDGTVPHVVQDQRPVAVAARFVW